MVEHRSPKPRAVGSSPSSPANFSAIDRERIPLAALIASLALIAAAAASPTGATAPTNATSLAKCIAFVAQGPDYAAVSDEDLGHNSGFLEAVTHACSDEALPLWDEAHARAFAELGLPGKSFPVPREYAGRAVGEMDVADRQLRSIISEHWGEARGLRHQTLTFPSERQVKFYLAWLMDDRQKSTLAAIIEKPVTCMGAAIRRDDSHFTQPDFESLVNGQPTQRVGKIAADCGHDAAIESLFGLIRQRFTTADPVLAKSAAEYLLGQLVFWSLTGQ